MEPHEEGLKNTRAKSSVSDASCADNSVDSESKPSRRQFVKNIGGLIFGLVLVDRAAHRVVAAPPCANPGDNDASCDGPGDHDGGCGNGNKDEGCSAAEPDENCHANGPGRGQGDTDENCTATSSDADQGCGDCNDAHDTDDHCGKPLGGGADTDDMCGHAHTIGIDTDDNCKSTGDSDRGCGTHKGPWGSEGDADEGCNPGPPDTDKNCTGKETDAYCDTNGTNTSTPDEHCGTAPPDHDSACEEWYDIDESCTGDSGSDMDESCGGLDTSAWPIKKTDADQNCGHDFGGGVVDADDRCGLPGTLPGSWWSDSTFG